MPPPPLTSFDGVLLNGALVAGFSQALSERISQYLEVPYIM